MLPTGQVPSSGINLEKGVALELASFITADPRFMLGGRGDRVQRIYPTDPRSETPPSSDDFLNVIQQVLITPTDSDTSPGEAHVVPKNNSKFGFANPSGKFDMVLVVPAAGRIQHPKYTEGEAIPTMLAGGKLANLGDVYETGMVEVLQSIADGGEVPEVYGAMLNKMEMSPEGMRGATVTQTTPNKRKLKPEPYDVGKLIADIIITGTFGKRYISVKNLAGSTFGNHGYGGGFEVVTSKSGAQKVIPGTGPGSTDDLVAALGINKARVARGVTNYLNKKKDPPKQRVRKKQISSIDPGVVQSWLASGIGFGYYYVREEADGSIKVIHLADASDAMDFVGVVTGVSLRYPQAGKSKQITAKVTTANGTFTVEIRNSSRGVIPNEFKFHVGKDFVAPSSLTENKNIMNKQGEILVRNLVRESLLLEELTKSDRKEIEKIARKQAQKEIGRVVGPSFEKAIHKEVQKMLKNKATRDEIASITKAVMKKLYKDLSLSYPQVIDRIKV